MSLLNNEFIQSVVTGNDPWCSSHGAEQDSKQLGAGILYYSLAYAFQSQVCVCLGSGGGYVPRLMRQAQRDLEIPESRTILVDGTLQVTAEKKSIWGEPCWIAEDSYFRTNYPDIEIKLQLTETAYNEFFLPENIQIDYLHIDADHHYEGAKLDWDLYHPLVKEGGIITLHDTVNYRKPCGVYLLIDEIREAGEFDVINFPLAYGTAILRRKLPDGRPDA